MEDLFPMEDITDGADVQDLENKNCCPTVYTIPSVVNQKIMGFFESIGSGNSFMIKTNDNGKIIPHPSFLKTLSKAIGGKILVSDKIDGQNAIIVNGILYLRFDWRKRAAIYDNGKFYPIHPTKFNADFKMSKLVKKSIDKVNPPPTSGEFVIVGSIDRTDALVEEVNGIPFQRLSNINHHLGECSENGYPEVIYIANMTISVCDIILPDETGKPMIVRNMPLQDILNLYKTSCITVEEISIGVQGDKYKDLGIRQGITTITPHGIFESKITLPTLCLPHPDDLDAVSRLIDEFFLATLNYIFPDKTQEPIREGIVVKFLNSDDTVVGYHKINQGHLETYVKFREIPIPFFIGNEEHTKKQIKYII